MPFAPTTAAPRKSRPARRPPGRFAPAVAALLTGLAAAGCVRQHPEEVEAPILSGMDAMAGKAPPAENAPPPYSVEMDTTAGPLLIRVHPEWAPLAAARFRELVETGFFDDTTFYRIEPGFVVQFGLSGDPAVTEKWRQNPLPDEPVRTTNGIGTLSFAKTSEPDSATSQVFLNTGSNVTLDDKFSPFADVVEGGEEFVENLFTEYRQLPPDQGRIIEEGDAYLKARFPQLSRIRTARVVADEASAAGGDVAASGVEPPAPDAATPDAATPEPAAPGAGGPVVRANDPPPAADPGEDAAVGEESPVEPETPAGPPPATPEATADPAADPGGATPVAGGASPGGR